MIRIIDATPKEEYVMYLGIFAQKLAILERSNSLSSIPFIVGVLSIDNMDQFSKLKSHDLDSICKELNHVANGYPELAGNAMTYDEFISSRRNITLKDIGI